MRRSRLQGDVRWAGAAVLSRRTRHDTANGVTQLTRKQPAGAMGGSGRDGLNLCEGLGAGEGTAALAKTARPSAFPPVGPEPEVRIKGSTT